MALLAPAGGSAAGRSEEAAPPRAGRAPPSPQRRWKKRQADQKMQPGPGEAGPPPAQSVDEKGARRPADRTGEAGKQRDAGDRIAGVTAIETGHGGKGRLVEAETHADADDRPAYDQPG